CSPRRLRRPERCASRSSAPGGGWAPRPAPRSRPPTTWSSSPPSGAPTRSAWSRPSRPPALASLSSSPPPARHPVTSRRWSPPGCTSSSAPPGGTTRRSPRSAGSWPRRPPGRGCSSPPTSRSARCCSCASPPSPRRGSSPWRWSRATTPTRSTPPAAPRCTPPAPSPRPAPPPAARPRPTPPPPP
ncbi:MAG: 4-hydroxy-tetrahydrodipicolinate reductase, partial [uncultured Quadrisphaera sp.]